MAAGSNAEASIRRSQRALDETGRTDLAAFEQDPQLLLLAGIRDIGDFDDFEAWEASRQAKIKQGAGLRLFADGRR